MNHSQLAQGTGEADADEGPAWATLLEGTVGSTAYGLDTASSDVDVLAIAAAPTSAFHGLRLPVGRGGTRVEHRIPGLAGTMDRQTHEIGKACALLLSCNPTVTELLWLPDDLYRSCDELGVELLSLRTAFLSAPAVRDAYLGFARSQLRRLERRDIGDDGDEEGRRKRAKNARHLWRLCHQGLHLLREGELVVRLEEDDIARCRAFGEAAGQSARHAIAHMRVAKDALEQAFLASSLPAEPDREAVDSWLRHAREVTWARERAGPDVAVMTSLGVTLTPAQARMIRSWRADNASWRGVAGNADEEWGPAYGGGGNQVFGMWLCEAAATLLGEDPRAEPWN